VNAKEKVQTRILGGVRVWREAYVTWVRYSVSRLFTNQTPTILTRLCSISWSVSCPSSGRPWILYIQGMDQIFGQCQLLTTSVNKNWTGPHAWLHDSGWVGVALALHSYISYELCMWLMVYDCVYDFRKYFENPLSRVLCVLDIYNFLCLPLCVFCVTHSDVRGVADGDDGPASPFLEYFC